MKNEKELLNAKEIKTIEHGITSKKNAIARYQKKYKKILNILFSIRQYEEETDKLINLGNTLNSKNIVEHIKSKKDKPVKLEANQKF